MGFKSSLWRFSTKAISAVSPSLSSFTIAGTADSPRNARRSPTALARHKLITPAVYGANHKGLKQTVSFMLSASSSRASGVEFLTGLAEIGLYIHEDISAGAFCSVAFSAKSEPRPLFNPPFLAIFILLSAKFR